MTKIVVLGGSGLIGSKVVARLAEHGHEAIAASPKSGVNTLTGEGLAEVLSGAQVVVDVSNSPSFEDKAVLGLDELIRKGLSFRGDSRVVVADPEARYFGALLEERILLPSADALNLDPRFEDWLVQTAPQN
jgi:nucleoside-diphosphate-sugar epimerase